MKLTNISFENWHEPYQLHCFYSEIPSFWPRGKRKFQVKNLDGVALSTSAFHRIDSVKFAHRFSKLRLEIIVHKRQFLFISYVWPLAYLKPFGRSTNTIQIAPFSEDEHIRCTVNYARHTSTWRFHSDEHKSVDTIFVICQNYSRL